MLCRFASVVLTLCGVLAWQDNAQGEDWPRFRGPNGTGVSDAEELPVQFGPDNNVVWKIESGKGTSSPIIAGTQLYYTSYDGDTRTLHCRNAETGDTIWEKSVDKRRDENASSPNGPATSSPACDGNNVVAFYPDAGIFCYSAQGDLRWQADAGPFHSMHGIASSPIIVDSKVILAADQMKGSYVAAYDVETGERKWKVDRLDGLTGAYSTPSIFPASDGTSHIVMSGPREVVGYHAATGEVAWSVTGATNAPVTLPVLSGRRVFVCEPVGTEEPISMLAPLDKNQDGKFTLEEVKANVPIYRLLERMDNRWGNGDGSVDAAEWDQAFGNFLDKGGLVAIDLDETNEGIKAAVRWSYRKTVPYVASVLVYRDVLYFVQDGGIVTSLDPDTGEVHKRGRLKKGGKQFYASPVAADGKVILVDTDGKVSVLQAGAEWKVLATNSLDERCFASPCINAGRLYLRTRKSLYCFADSE